MKILMLSWEYPPRIVGGISRVVHDLAQKLGEHGNEVHIVTCSEAGAPDEEKDKYVYVHRVKTYDIETVNFVDWVLQLNYALIEKSIKLFNSGKHFDILHAHDWVVAFAARVIKNSFTVPLVSTIHATESGRNWGIHNEIQRYIHNVEWYLTYESWRVVVNSIYMNNEVSHLFKLPPDKIRIVPNGIDVDKFDGIEGNPDFRRNFAVDSEKIIFFVGRLVNEKGAHVILDAMPRILIDYHDVKLVIAGKGPETAHLKEKAALLGLSDKVYFTGYIEDESLLKLYKCADIAVFPSLYEPFGIVALEGMVAGVPVVVSDTGGLGELVIHGVDGMKSYPGNPDSLADSILTILNNPKKADEMKKNALNKVRSRYNWDTISGLMLDTYNEVLDECKKQKWGIS